MQSFTKNFGLSLWDQGDVPDVYNGPKANANTLAIDKALIPHGNAFPSKRSTGELFIKDDEPALYKNTGPDDSPVWTLIFKISLAAAAGCTPQADGAGKISSDWLKTGPAGDLDVKSVGGKQSTDLVLRDGSQAMTGDLDLGGNEIKNLKAPSAQSSAARLADVQGLKVVTVRVATTVAKTLASDFENGDTIDGVVLATNDRVLIKNQVLTKDNGVYTVNASGAPTRATDADITAELEGLYVIVQLGTANTGTKWFQTARGFTLGTDPVTFVQDPGTTYAPGNGIDISGNVISAKLGNGQEIVAGAIEPKLDGASLVKSASGLKVSGLAIPEGGRAVRTTDQDTAGAADVIFTTVKSNQNAVFNLGGSPTLYTVQQGGISTIQGWVRLKKGSSGTYARLALVNVDTAEEIAVDERNDRISNQRNRYLSVSVSDNFDPGMRLKLAVTTDADDNGKVIEAASLSGACQGAGVIGAGGGVDLAESLLLKSYFSHNGMLPAATTFEAIYDYPARDFTFLSASSTLGVSRARSKFTEASGGAGVSVWGWDTGALRDEMLLVFGMFRPRVNAMGFFFCTGAPSTNDAHDDAYIALWEVSSFRIGLYKKIAGVWTLLTSVSTPQPFDNPGAPNMALAFYYKDSTDQLTVLMRFGSEMWLDVINITDASIGKVRYAGIYQSSNGNGQIAYSGCPAMLRHE